MRKLLENGEYFKEARIWYNELYLQPYTARSGIAIAALVAIILALLLALNINALLPLHKQIRYAIQVADSSDYAAYIESADDYGNDVKKSIARIFARTYIEIREGYDYNDLASRMLYVQNNSTKVLYNKYASFLSLDNPDSPVLRFQKYAKRLVEVKSFNFINDEEAVVIFKAKAIGNNGRSLEDSEWEARISFIIDKIDVNLPENTPFNFTVSDYKIKLIRDYNAK